MRYSPLLATVAIAISAVFPPKADASSLSTICSFGSGSGDALSPYGIQSVGGILYGGAGGGNGCGGSGCGTIFKCNPATGTESVIYRFMDLSDGGGPTGDLVNINKFVYGMAFSGGVFDQGAIFQINLSTGHEKVIHSFVGKPGTYPRSGLLDIGGILYGTTEYTFKGLKGYGIIFSYNTLTRAYSVLHQFQGGGDGGYPFATLINVSGIAYGTTAGGQSSGSFGTLFSFDPVTGKESVIHSFSNTDGSEPISKLVQIGSTLYGVTLAGGPTGNGVLFSYNIASHNFSVLHNFSGFLNNGSNDGRVPKSLTHIGNIIYGLAAAGGGALDNGAIFKFDTSSGIESVVYSFNSPANVGVLVNSGGVLLGTAGLGGTYNNGLIFKFKP